jgi:hypothetical protein
VKRDQYDAAKPWSVTLVFVDQYGNRHELENCVFREVTMS